MPERKTLNEDLFYRGSSANLPRLHTCKNEVPIWDFSQFAVTRPIHYSLDHGLVCIMTYLQVLFQTIQFSISTHVCLFVCLFVYSLIVKIFLFQAIQFSQTVQIQTIQFIISVVLVYIQLNVKTVLFQTIQLSESTVSISKNSSISNNLA